MTTTEATTSEVKTTIKRVAKPNEEQYKASLEEVNKNIEKLKIKLAEAQTSLSNSSGNGADGSVRKELRINLENARNELKQVSESRQKLIDQLKKIQKDIKVKTDEVKSSKDKIGYKNVEEVDQQIANLERQLQAGQLKLAEEKKIVSEISNLKKSRKTLEGFSSKASTISEDKNSLDEIRKQLDLLDPARTAAKESLEKAKKAFEEFDEENKKKKGSVDSLVSKRNQFKSELDAEFARMRELKNAHFQQKDEYFKYIKVERERKQQEYLKRKEEERDLKLAAQAEAERELAESPAYLEEINTCNGLINFFNGLTATPATKTEEATAPKPVSDMIPFKKKDEQEDYLFLGKGKKKNKGNAGPDLKKTIKMGIDMIDNLVKFGIEIPTTIGDAPAAVAALEAKKQEYLDNQAAKTEENKKLAEEKIAQLKAKMLEKSSSPVA